MLPLRNPLRDKALYGEDLSEKGDYEKAAEIFFGIVRESEGAKIHFGRTCKSLLISQGVIKMPTGFFITAWPGNEKWMQDFSLWYLNWQMDNHDYVDTAETFSAIQKDIRTPWQMTNLLGATDGRVSLSVG